MIRFDITNDWDNKLTKSGMYAKFPTYPDMLCIIVKRTISGDSIFYNISNSDMYNFPLNLWNRSYKAMSMKAYRVMYIYKE